MLKFTYIQGTLEILLKKEMTHPYKIIGTRFNIYCDIFVGQVTWAYIIQRNQNHN